MAWTATGQPTVRKQREKWAVRVDAIDTATGNHRPRQLGTYASQRSEQAAARSMRAEDRSTERGTVSWLVRRYVASRTDITEKAQQQYAWAIPHIENGLGAIPLATLDRDDVARWIEGLASGGKLSKRSVQICRTVLRAALSEAVEEGLLARSPAARVGLLAPSPSPRGRRRRWPGLLWRSTCSSRSPPSIDGRSHSGWESSTGCDAAKSSLCAGTTSTRRRAPCGSTRASSPPTKAPRGATPRNERSRRTIPIDDDTMRAFAKRRAEQVAERLAAGTEWEDNDLIITTRTGRLVLPRSYDRALATIVGHAGLPRLTSHGLRHTAATHMVQSAHDLGELRAIADLLGQSPEMLMNTYAHALPNGQAAVVERLRRQ
jgi:hypothetical protein